MKQFLASLVVALLVVLMFSSPSSAALIWGTDASGELSGSRDYTQVEATGGWDDSFEVSWNITYDGFWNYTYCVTGDKDLSHFILEVTQDCAVPILSLNSHEGPKLWDKDYLPDDIFGVKFEGFDNECRDGQCFTLITDRAPVYGDFYAKSGYDPKTGEWTYAFNNGLLDPYSCDTFDFIVRPDGDIIPTPEPATMAMLGIGLGAVGFSRRRKRRDSGTA